MTRSPRYKTSLVLLGSLLLATGFQGVSRAVVVTDTQIKDQVTAHVKEQLGTMVSKADQPYVSVVIPQVPTAPFDFPEATKLSDVKITVTSRLGATYSDRGIVQVSLKDAHHHREIGVPVLISVKKPVWVTKNVINANEPLRAADFSLETKDVSHSYTYAVGADRDLGTYIARVNLRPGEILDARKMVIPPDVTYNNEVRILISNGNGMTVTVPGIALANGRVGETIRVRQAVYQRKYYSARIIDRNQVLVEL